MQNRDLSADRWKRLGDECLERREARRALACYRSAERAGRAPECLLAGRWFSHMLLGEFERAWRQSDFALRLRRENRVGFEGEYTLWDGEPFEGRDILVRCCHGLGDTIQFSRYLPLLRPRCRSVIFQVQRELMPLFANAPYIDRMTPAWEWLPAELESLPQIEVMELPFAFRTTIETIPQPPYLFAEPVQFSSSRFNVGIVWAPSNWDPTRSVPLELLAQFADLPNVSLHSLQWGISREGLRSYPKITDLVARIQNPHSIAETASFIQSLDLLIAPDTMAAHLAGALGKPVWVLLLHAADWRWMIGRDDSPWYPTMRLFRQPTPGDWTTPIQHIARELASLAVMRIDVKRQRAA